MLYPAGLRLEEKTCLIIGFGKVGQRKLSGLKICNPKSVIVLDTRPFECLADGEKNLLRDPAVEYHARTWKLSDLEGKFLVFSCTGDKAENIRIANACSAKGILCNCASSPISGTMQLPSVARKNDSYVALSTGGASPYLSKKWRKELEDWLQSKYKFILLMKQLRPLILSLNYDSIQNKIIFQRIAESSLDTFIMENDKKKCKSVLTMLLPKPLHPYISEVINDIS
ncbi:MAG: bifunctional precorrin-2 dehydrogenase/sirohydrochlorin ferrochelatase [Desulfovibrio sp.]|nr:bifunctional precorrin-2 dehydrogenase/sirohydrochlorin ferrochelatase [Desulfovibrio sp.]